MASYKTGSITLENVYGKKTYETTIVECDSSTELQELTITENGTYEAPKGTGYSPVMVNVKLEGNPLQDVIDNKGGDGIPSCYKLLWGYLGTSVDSILTSVDTSKSTSMESMLWGCENLITIPQIDTSSSTNMKSMFYECKKITTIPQLNTSNVTSMNSMFYYCHKLTNVPVLDTSNVTDMGYMFYNCQELTSIPSLNVANVTSFTSIFSSCYKLTSIGMYGFTRSIDISSTKLKHDALVAFLNQAGTAYNSSQKITMGSTKLALLSDKEKTIATNKGWTLA